MVSTVPRRPLAWFTTMGVGGHAPSIEVAETLEALRSGVSGSPKSTPLVLGGGSNVIVSDRGVDRPVVIYRSQAPCMRFRDDGVVWVSGSSILSDCVGLVVGRGYAGIEALIGIPGTLGGGIVQNVGAYGVEISDVVISVDVLDPMSGESSTLQKTECGFGYRRSRFKEDAPHAPVVSGATLQLVPNGAHVPKYRDLAALLQRRHGNLESGYRLDYVIGAVKDLRRSKGMLYERDSKETWSVGSFFLNPVIERSILTGLKRELAGRDIPYWPLRGGQVKLSAAWLVEQSGFAKGHGNDRVRLSPRHALALSNYQGKASALDAVELAKEIWFGVFNTTGVSLSPEPLLLGFSESELGPFSATATVAPRAHGHPRPSGAQAVEANGE